MNLKGLIVAVIVAAGLFYAFKAVRTGDAESEILKLAPYKALKEHDAKTYDKLVAELKRGVEGERSKEQVIAAARKHLDVLIKERVPKASDRAVVEYIDVTMQELDELYDRGDDSCHSLMFPQPGEAVDVSMYFSKSLLTADMNALAEVIETSALNPQALPTEGEAALKLAPVFQELADEIGDDIAVMQNPTAPGIDKRKVCKVVRALFTKVLGLPAEDASLVLRYMIANS